MESGGGESIRVFVRVRPPDPNLEEGCLNHAHCLEVNSTTSLSMQSRPEPKVFTFDHVAGMHTTQEDVFSSIGRPIIESCMCGYNGTIFAYGQTGSGKTFTMIGPTQDDSDSFTHELRGIIPRGFEYLFNLINREIEKYGELVEFLCKCSFLEIYNEQVFDLLDPASNGLHLRENMIRGVYVDGLTEQNICSARDAYQVLHTGWLNRRVASTAMNRESSRSHAVFILTIESKKRESKESVAKIKTSLLNLVDLAGSERQRDTHTAGLRLKEAGSINKSLSALGNVIMALVDIAHGKSRHVHYRDSKLTFLLRDSLGGNAKTNLVANVHPSARCFGETLSTLNFAKRAKMIKNKAVVNEDTSGNVHQLQSEIKRLRQLVDRLRNGMAVSIPLPSTPEEGGAALLAGPSVSYSPPNSHGRTSSVSSNGSMMSDDQKNIRQLRELLTHSMATREKIEASKMSLLERVENLQKLCDKKENFLQSTKMILKFRETHIGNMERGRKGEKPGGAQGSRGVAVGGRGKGERAAAGAESAEEKAPNEKEASLISLLQQEVEQLKYQRDHHPDLTKFALENLDLRAELKKARASASGNSGVHRELARSHQYTLQLERQLRHYLARGTGDASSPVKVGATGTLRPQSGTTNDAQTVAVEKLQNKCSHIQADLEKARRQLATETEEFHLKECKMEASLNTARKTNQELERSIEALKLKSSVEKATLNDLHMNTIRSMLTPKKSVVHVPKSISNSPFRRADSDPIKQSLDFSPSAQNGPSSASPTCTSPPTIPESPPELCKKGTSGLVRASRRGRVSVATNTDISGDLPAVGGLTELNIEGALTDELKLLQDGNRHLQSQLEEAESSVFHLEREKSVLSAQLAELQHVSHSEHEALVTREQDLLEKVAEMTTSIADLTSTNTVLNSEVVDLRVCLQSADKELLEVKTGRKRDKKVHDGKLMDCMQKIGELEQVLSSKVADLERQTEDLQNIQDEAETGREELTFKDHRISELEQALISEKEHTASLTSETQGVMERLAREVERNTQLSSELQEGESGKQELVKALNENLRLSSSVTELESDMKRQLQQHQRQMEEAQTTIASLHTRQMADREAIGSLMAQLQEVRSSLATEKARVGSLKKELQDTSRELGEASSRINRQTMAIESLQTQIKTMAMNHGKEIQKKDSEREVVSEELEHISEQHQQLSAVFSAQSAALAQVEVEGRQMRERLALRESELARLRQKRERRASVNKAQSFEDVKSMLRQSDEEKDRLRSELDKAVAMIGNYEQTREEKELELRRLQEELKAQDAQQLQMRLLETKFTTVQYQLEEQQQKEARLSQELRDRDSENERLQIDYLASVRTRDQVLQERAGLQKTIEEQRSTVESLNDQLRRYKSIEQRLFEEKQSLRSQLEALGEEKSKLAKECACLAKENAVISGHQNLRQKIHYHASTKIENSKLKEEVILLEKRLRMKTTEFDLLQKKVNDLMREPPDHTHNSPVLELIHAHSKWLTPPTRLPHVNAVSLLKENVIPK